MNNKNYSGYASAGGRTVQDVIADAKLCPQQQCKFANDKKTCNQECYKMRCETDCQGVSNSKTCVQDCFKAVGLSGNNNS